MAEPIVLISESPEEARDLAALLARHGRPVRSGHEEVEVFSPWEQTNVLLADLAVALRSWLDDRNLESASVRAGSRRLVYDRAGRYRVDVRERLTAA